MKYGPSKPRADSAEAASAFRSGRLEGERLTVKTHWWTHQGQRGPIGSAQAGQPLPRPQSRGLNGGASILTAVNPQSPPSFGRGNEKSSQGRPADRERRAKYIGEWLKTEARYLA